MAAITHKCSSVLLMVVAGYLMLTSHLKKKTDLLNTSLCRVLVCHQAVYTDVSISAGASKTKSL